MWRKKIQPRLPYLNPSFPFSNQTTVEQMGAQFAGNSGNTPPFVTGFSCRPDTTFYFLQELNLKFEMLACLCALKVLLRCHNDDFGCSKVLQVSGQ